MTSTDILGKAGIDMFGEELEYAADAPDFGDVLARRRDLRMKGRSGEEMTLPCTVMRVVSTDVNAPASSSSCRTSASSAPSSSCAIS